MCLLYLADAKHSCTHAWHLAPGIMTDCDGRAEGRKKNVHGSLLTYSGLLFLALDRIKNFII